MTQDVNVPDNEQPDILSEMLSAARASRGTVDGSPYSSGRQDEVDDRELANEWQMAAADVAHDEIQALRVVARTRANDSAYSAWMTAQWFEARRKQHAAEARVVDLERQLAEALKDSAYEHEALLKAQARIAELEAAVRFAEPAPAEPPAPDDDDTTSCASVRMDNASQRPRVEVPPLVRKPAKMTDEEAEIQFPDNQRESADPAA